MKAVARLLLAIFVGSPASRWLTGSGLLMILASLYVVLYLPHAEHMLALAVPGLITFFLGSILMPATLGRLAGSHLARILPAARLKLLASAVLTVLLVALPAGLLTPLAYVAGMSADVSSLRKDPALLDYTLGLALITYTSACLAAVWIYTLVWFIGNERGLAGLVKGLLVTALFFAIPFGALARGQLLLAANLMMLALILVVFSAGFLCWPRLRPRIAGWRPATRRQRAREPRELSGREMALLLGTARPWMMIGALALTFIAIARQPESLSPSVSLFLLVTTSCVSGAVSGQLPARARLLWLLGDWTRAQLFVAVEKAAWRHNALVLLVLLAMFVVIATLVRLPPRILATGIAVLALGCSLSTYLGLMRTRGTSWLESSLGVFVIAVMMVMAWQVGEDRIDAWLSLATLALLGTLAIILRASARRRWQHIDWSVSRGETQRALRLS